MRIYVYPADTYGCGHYRLTWPAESVRVLGGDVEIIPPNGDRQLGARLNRDGTPRDVILPDDADVIVLQRPTHRILSHAIPLMRAQGVAVVVDMDDDLSTIHPKNPAFGSLHPRSHTIHSWNNAAFACKNASLVTVSAEQLTTRYGGHGRVRVLRNGVPRKMLDIEHSDSDVLGWGGSVHSHPNDLQVVGSAISELTRDGAVFRVAGTGDDVARVLQLDDNPDASGLVEFDDWGDEITRIGIGIAPLADTVFNASKSWLKPLEYAAVGVPWVASPRAEYVRLRDLGCGVTVERPREWKRVLRDLIGSPERRVEMSEQGREVARKLTIEERAHEWYEAWTLALEIERG